MQKSHEREPDRSPDGPPGSPRRDLIETVTSATFGPLVLEAKGPVVVEFMSYGCSHCRAIEPVLQEVAETVRSKEKVYRVNIALEQELASRYQVEGTPTLIMYLSGAEVGRAEGPSPTASSLLTVMTEPFES
jgi:thioredoxin 1